MPWATALISEATTANGPWTLIDTIILSPVDGDPDDPVSRSLTAVHGTLANGWYTIVFRDGSSALSQPSDPIQNISTVDSEIRPSVNRLGGFMRGRTVMAGTAGMEAGTFNDQTRPTGDEADELIDLAVSAVLMQTGPNIPVAFYQQTSYAVLVQAAMLVELTFYRNEVNRDQSAYAQYEQLYKDTIAALRMSIANEDPASAAPSFYSVPVLNDRQAHWQRMFAAFDPKTGVFDPSKLGPEEYYPMGMGGIPAGLVAQWPWVFGTGLSSGVGDGLAFLED